MALSTFQAPVARIGIRPGRRPLDLAHVDNLAVSIGEIGQRTPIELVAVSDDDPAREQFTYWLNAGGHRLGAILKLQRRWIDAVLVDDDDLTAKIAEVDENLIRRDFTALERAQAIAARLEAFAGKYPDRVSTEDGENRPKRGRPQKIGHGARISASAMGFTRSTATQVGLSEETVRRDLAVYRGIPAALQAELIGTPHADNPGLLRQIASLGDRDEQAKVVGLLVKGETRSVSDARAIAAGNAPTPPDPADLALALEKLWGKASPSARAAFLLTLSARSLPDGWRLNQENTDGSSQGAQAPALVGAARGAQGRRGRGEPPHPEERPEDGVRLPSGQQSPGLGLDDPSLDAARDLTPSGRSARKGPADV